MQSSQTNSPAIGPSDDTRPAASMTDTTTVVISTIDTA